MSWFYKLCELYDKLTAAGEQLAPVYFMPSSTPFEVTLSEQGTFVSCSIVGQGDRLIDIPITIKAEVRGGNIAPRPIFDNLTYIAKDYDLLQADTRLPGTYEAYLEQLKAWAESDGVHPAVPIIYKYLEQGTIVQDMLDCGAIPRVAVKKELVAEAKAAGQPIPLGKPKAALTGISGKMSSYCVRFRIAWEDSDKEPNIWRDKAFCDSWVNYEKAQMRKVADAIQMSHATGEMTVCSNILPSHARNVCDRTHIISMNDDTGFSWKNEIFSTAESRSTVGLEEAYKVTGTMRWLLKHNGMLLDDGTAIMLWTDSGACDLDLNASDYSLLRNAFNKEHGIVQGTDEADAFAYPVCAQPELHKLLYKAIMQANASLELPEHTYLFIVQGGDTGRLHVLDFEEFNNSALMDALLDWHEHAVANAWNRNSHAYVLRDAALSTLAMYITGGVKDGKFAKEDKLYDGCMQQLIRCKMAKQPIPYSYVGQLTAKLAKSKSEVKPLEWRSLLHAACCMINKYRYDVKKEEPIVNLDRSITNRSYLFGRLFAVLQYMDAAGRKAATAKSDSSKEKESILSQSLQGCITTPAMQAARLLGKAYPWLQKCSEGQRIFIEKEYDEISSTLKVSDWNNKALDNLWALGFAHEQQWLYTSRKGIDDIADEADAAEEAITTENANAETDTDENNGEQLTLL